MFMRTSLLSYLLKYFLALGSNKIRSPLVKCEKFLLWNFLKPSVMQHILTWISYNISICGTKIWHLCQSGKICAGQSLVEGHANMFTDKQTHSLAAIILFVSSQQMETRQQCSNFPLRIQMDQSEHLYFLFIGYKRVIYIYNNYILKMICTRRVFYLSLS